RAGPRRMTALVDVERDAFFMRRALELAERGRGLTSPNPMVGAVVVRDGEIVGEGYHERAGGPHAEVVALAAAGARTRGAPPCGRLEPCPPRGRTPPCARAVIDAGVQRVVAALVDPNPKVSGRGLVALRAAGLEVAPAVLTEHAERQNRTFVSA